ncbi:MAG: FAD-dependent oxidoreductase [Martelella sp.]|uniref:NAD(P)/FAD-dependent oxidoreductase n=1 Tax=Martelella sp. TaxID=1969699 RepID=UPI003241EC2A
MQLPSLPASLWRQDRSLRPQDFPALGSDVSCDVAIIGGGYCGLHAALAFAEKGLSVVVLEAGSVGLGGSGRNGGVVSAKFRRGFADLAAAHGMDVARRMHAIANASVAHLVETIERHAIADTGFRRVGALKCAHSAKAFEHARHEAEWLTRILGERGLHILDRADVRDETGCDSFVGGVLQDGAGTIQPLAYLQGLWRAAGARGVQVHADTPALDVAETGSGVIVSTAGARVVAGQAVLATNAYSGLTGVDRAVARSIVPFRSAMVATARLPADLDARLLKNERSYTETRRMMRWFRKVDGRIVFGGRGALGHVEAPAAFSRLEKAMHLIFPELRGIGIDYRWSGHVALSFDGLPMAGMLSPRIGYAAGFNGAGVAMSGYVGDQLANMMMKQPHELALIARGSIPKVPFYPLRSAGVRGVTFFYEMMDAAGL